MLSPAGFAFAELDRHPRPDEPAPDCPDHIFFLGGLQDVVVLDVRRIRGETAVAEPMSFVVRLLEDEELDLGSDHGHEPCGGCLLDLGLQDPTWRHLDR